jgi:hypothetical protein
MDGCGRSVMLTGTAWFRSATDDLAAGILTQLLFVVFSCFRDVRLVAGLGYSPHKRGSACGS